MIYDDCVHNKRENKVRIVTTIPNTASHCRKLYGTKWCRTVYMHFRITRGRNYLTVTHKALEFPASSAHQPCGVVTSQPVKTLVPVTCKDLWAAERDPDIAERWCCWRWSLGWLTGCRWPLQCRRTSRLKKKRKIYFASGVASCLFAGIATGFSCKRF